MKILINLIGMTLMGVGCISTGPINYAYGRDFDEKLLAKIEKEKTSAAEMKSLFGEPITKSVLSANEVKWMYIYTHGIAKAHRR